MRNEMNTLNSEAWIKLSEKVATTPTDILGDKINITIPQGIFDTKIDLNEIFKSEDNKPLTEQQTSQAAMLLEKKLCQEMLNQALGYSYCEEKTIYIKVPKTGQWIETRKEVTKKHQSGNSQLFIMYLTNKYPDLWKVSKELIHGKTESYDAEPSQRDRKKIESLARQLLDGNSSNSG
ncbi:MAG: hypothetical protein PHH82_04580 [Candidatus ainarchaeum sp.]|nr:hypothetical protein [Candidatus ainarchaeum sp.]